MKRHKFIHITKRSNKKYNLDKSNEIVKYSDLITLMSAFLNKEVDLMFITSNYESKFSNLETYNKILIYLR